MILLATVVAASAAPEDAPETILVLNDGLLDAIRLNGTAPPVASRQMAMLNAAMFDAVNGVTEQYEAYVFPFAGPAAGYPAAAAAAAGSTVLLALYPADAAAIEARFDMILATMPRTLQRRQSVAYGQLVADNLVALRSTDGSTDVVPYVASGLVGRWEPTPPAYTSTPALPPWPGVDPWALDTGDQFAVPGPPTLDSPFYTVHFAQVRDLGRNTSTLRTGDQTEIANFWADGAGTATPPGHWLVITQDVALLEGWTIQESARAFALVSIALADAAIASWDAKYLYDHHRPVTAIQEHAALDDNPFTVADPTWTPLLTTPAFPEYVSGHSTFSGAASSVLAAIVGTDAYHFVTVAEEPAALGIDRSYNAFSQAADEAGMSRIYGGIHFQHGNADGLALGRAIGAHVVATQLLPCGP